MRALVAFPIAFVSLASLAGLAGCARAPSPPAVPTRPTSATLSHAASTPNAVGHDAWTRLLADLPGTWTTERPKGRFAIAFRPISSGSALVETWGAGTPRETMSVFHPDGDALVLTHYCAQGNQPRLRAAELSSGVSSGVSTDTPARAPEFSVVFRFESATNQDGASSMLVERTLRLSADTLENTEVYRAPSGELERTTERFTREAR